MLIEDPHQSSTPVLSGPAQRTEKPSRMLRIVLPVAAIVILMLWILGAFRRGVIQSGKEPIPMESAAGKDTFKVTATTLPATSEAVGTVQAEQIASVSSQVMASILQLRAAAGQKVTKGDVLAVLDDRELRHRLDQSEEAVSGAQATADQALSDYNRDKPLFEQKVITPLDFEHDQTNLKAAQANLRRMEQAKRETAVNLSYAVIRAPFNGVVVDKLAMEGDMAAPGKPLLTLYEQGRLWLEANVPEQLMESVHLHNSMQVRIAAAREMIGQVVEIIPSSDPATRTEVVRVHLPETPDLVPGMFGRLIIPVEPETVVLVPAAALIRVGQLTMVDVAREGAVERRTVQLGRRIADQYEVLSGLTSGETVVLPGTLEAPSANAHKTENKKAL